MFILTLITNQGCYDPILPWKTISLRFRDFDGAFSEMEDQVNIIKHDATAPLKEDFISELGAIVAYGDAVYEWSILDTEKGLVW